MTADKHSQAKVLLVDDHPAIRQGLDLLIKSLGHKVAGEAGSKTETLSAIKNNSFQLVILDLSLEDGSGLELLSALSERGIPALIYSMHETHETITQAMRNGARGYVTKREEPDALLDGVGAVLRGELFFSPRSTQILAEKNIIAEASPLFLLSDREREIFKAMGCGISNTEIAQQLDISPRTVETYLSRIVNKLGLNSIPTLRKFAISARQIEPHIKSKNA